MNEKNLLQQYQHQLTGYADCGWMDDYEKEFLACAWVAHMFNTSLADVQEIAIKSGLYHNK